MIPEKLRPTKLHDLIDRADDYVSLIREYGAGISEELKGFVFGYMRDVPLDRRQLKSIAALLADSVYQYANTTRSMDSIIPVYFADVAGYLFTKLADRQIDIFYILDNDFSSREDRFQLTARLFEAAGFAVVSPHKLWHGFAKIEAPEQRLERVSAPFQHPGLKASDNSTLGYDAVESILLHHVKALTSVIYIEKNDDVHYLEKVRQIAIQTKYTVIFRNEGVTGRNIRLIQ